MKMKNGRGVSDRGNVGFLTQKTKTAIKQSLYLLVTELTKIVFRKMYDHNVFISESFFFNQTSVICFCLGFSCCSLATKQLL